MEKKIVVSSLVVILIASFSSYFFLEKDFSKVKKVENTVNSYNTDLEYDIEDITYLDKDVLIKGWLAEINSTNQYINRAILLKDEGGNIIAIKTEAENRPDLNEKNTDTTNYNRCGLIGRVRNSELISNKKYEIGFKVISQDEKEQVIFTGEFIEIS